MKNYKITLPHFLKISCFYSLTLFMALLFSCQSDKQSNAKYQYNLKLEVDTIENEQEKINYRIPSPLDIFMLLKNNNKTFIAENLSNLENKSKYNSLLSKSVNFGIYSSDLAYSSVFGAFQESINYFKTLKQLANDLGMYEGFGEDMANRVQNNLTNVDSLVELSVDSYSTSNAFLSSMGMSDIMSLIISGCWIESLYLSIKSVEDFDKEQKIVERIADQQLLLDNVIQLIVKNQENSSLNLEEVLNQLLDLQQEYDRLYENEDNVLITKSQFVEIANRVQIVRSNFSDLN